MSALYKPYQARKVKQLILAWEKFSGFSGFPDTFHCRGKVSDSFSDFQVYNRFGIIDASRFILFFLFAVAR